MHWEKSVHTLMKNQNFGLKAVGYIQHGKLAKYSKTCERTGHQKKHIVKHYKAWKQMESFSLFCLHHLSA